ncbi:MAG: zf-HC2 domain-containing protein [Gemmatimonadetes bacterium]|nr:zf-HC2 domain-containing protein [Gemmatimonadota bacterium]MBT8477286.1 zf-HC2 domain-containing protein [Gemmatimonadota bacterium]NNK47673.1 zf-HC2 domain-containing protein [Gemmatimonadota bacterium]
MSCDQFVERYTDFRDGLLDAETREEVQMHLASCSCCARYDRVMQRGLELLSDLPLTESSDDFMPRLRHRLYNVDCGVERRRSFGGSAALVGVAAVGLLALFWLPFAASVPLEMELPAVSAQFPPPGSVEMPSLFRSGPFVTTLLLEDESHLDGYLTEFQWPPPPQLRSSVAIEASYLRSEPALFNR